MYEAPTFVPPVAREISGDDPLGLAPVNQRLYGSVFPGINNVVQYIRVYSALCWQVDRIERYFATNSLSKEDAIALYSQAMEKIQLLLTWANPNVPNRAGAQRPFPTDDRPVALVFDSFGPNRAAYLEPVQYRPSLTDGLGFAEFRGQGMLGNLKAGEALAAAFDAHARTHPDYAWLADVTALNATPARVAALQPVLDLISPSPEEQRAFLAQYFPERRPHNLASPQAHRWAALLLALRTIEAINTTDTSADVKEVRIAMARGFGPDGQPLDLRAVELEQQWWAVLQVRQLQRLALDTLEAILERRLDICVSQSAPRDMAAICADVQRQLELHLGTRAQLPLREHWHKLKQHQGLCHTLYQAAVTKPEADVFTMIDALWAVPQPDPDGTFPALANCFDALLACAVEAVNLQANEEAHEALTEGTGQGSLAELVVCATQFADQTPGAWLAYLMQHWVINRHFEVVTFRSQRSNDSKNRFRFVVGDTGLQRYDMTIGPSVPPFAEDRLRHALLLLQQSGLIELESLGYVLTDAGRRRLV